MESVWECKGKKKNQKKRKGFSPAWKIASQISSLLALFHSPSVPLSTLLGCVIPGSAPLSRAGASHLAQSQVAAKEVTQAGQCLAVSSWGIGSCAGAWLGLLCWIFPQHLSSKSWKHKVGLMETSEVLFPRGQLIPGSDAIPQCTPPNQIT